MNNEDNNNNKIDPSTEKDNNILSDEFFSEINNLKKLNERKAKIDYITNYLKPHYNPLSLNSPYQNFEKYSNLL